MVEEVGLIFYINGCGYGHGLAAIIIKVCMIPAADSRIKKLLIRQATLPSGISPPPQHVA